MSATIFCIYLQRDAEPLPRPPWPGELGQRIFQQVSKPAWQEWLAHQTMLINENRLSPLEPEHRLFLEREMEKFFFHGGAEKPEGYQPPKADE
ncbi:MAG: oxidative damage protection protein [Gammaproteobacteria bacterium]|nr:oxidative damage protection protein [Gammaproteobacteria bacterium]